MNTMKFTKDTRSFFTSLLSSCFVYFTVLLLINVAFAQVTQLTKAMKDICLMFEGLLPVLAFVLFILAGVAYAAGNFFGAEMRAKAVGYAMSMLTGAIIALVLSIIAPTIIGALSGKTWSKCADIQ